MRFRKTKAIEGNSQNRVGCITKYYIIHVSALPNQTSYVNDSIFFKKH